MYVLFFDTTVFFLCCQLITINIIVGFLHFQIIQEKYLVFVNNVVTKHNFRLTEDPYLPYFYSLEVVLIYRNDRQCNT